MRKEFAKMLHKEMRVNENIYLITADLGYGMWDKIRKDYPTRFINTMSSEQLMLGLCCGLAMEGKIALAYSITPFLLYRPFEWIRNYLNHEKIPVKLIGAGRDKEYGYLGFSHWAEEDLEILSNLKNIETYKPKKINSAIFKTFIYSSSPGYINLKR